MSTVSETVSALGAIDFPPHRSGAALPPDRKKIVEIIKRLQAILFPVFFKFGDIKTVAGQLYETEALLAEQVEAALRFNGNAASAAQTLTEEFIRKLPGIKKFLVKDVVALYEGDPAAKSYDEVLLCYPGFYAVSIYRIAHELYCLGVPLLPRIMTEYAHEKTGIDIHAGASIGEYFFIDHGTGIVIGETTVIGNRVKLYQGVTLGAKSFELDENGNPVKNIKRHPNVGNNVVIYANATILGGETTIGDNCVIGASVWLTSSVEPGSHVYYTASAVKVKP